MTPNFLDLLTPPPTDATPVFDLFRGNCATEVLVVAVTRLRFFDRLAAAPRTFEELQGELALRPRPLQVVLTTLQAMALVRAESGRYGLTESARQHLVADSPYYVGSYLALAGESPGVLQLWERLRTDRPQGADDEAGAAFIYKDEVASAMEREESARFLTQSLAGRARNVAPELAAKLPMPGRRHLVDVGAGSGLYSLALLQKNPELAVTMLDRPEVLTVAREYADRAGVRERVRWRPGDMFKDLPESPVDDVLLSNVLHDWGDDDCRQIVARWAAVLPPGGRLVVHDVFLDDDLAGPLPVALYSVSLFGLTEGRAYSRREFTEWMSAAGLNVGEFVATSIHCGYLIGTKPPNP